MANEELTQEEKDKAAELAADAQAEKSTNEKIAADLSAVTDLLKSAVEKKTEEKTEPEKEEIDFENMDTHKISETLAKSFAEDKEKAVEFIKEFMGSCGLNPQDMVDGDGNEYIDEEMLKSLEESQAKGERYLAGILYSMQETNSRNAKKDEVVMHTMMNLAKAVVDINSVVTELQKSFAKPEEEGGEEVEGKEKKEGLELPTLDSDEPISELDTSMKKSISKAEFMKALKKSFPGKHGNSREQEKYNEYADQANRLDPEMVIGLMDDGDRSLVEGNLLPV
jgi:hypothetical protein